MSEDEPIWRTPSNQEWAGSKAWARQFGAKRREVERLARREWISEVKARLGLVTIDDRPGERTFATYEEARAAVDAEMEAFAAALPGRAQEVADRINAMLPDGLRFEWVPASEDQAPDPLAALGDSVALGFGDGIASAVRAAFGEDQPCVSG